MLDRKGDYAATSLYAASGNKPVRYALCTDDHPRTETAEALFEGNPEDEG
jgi:hypothetical protein